MEAIRVNNLTVKIDGKIIIEDVSLTVREGEFWAIVGPNGGGKTTLLKAIMGILKPERGSVEVFGESPEVAVKRGWIGYLPQKPDFNMNLRVRDIFRLVGADDRDVSGMVEVMGISDKMDSSFLNLSGGERQRVLISMLLLKNPRILLLDEPNTGIDVVGQDNFYKFLRNRDKNCTILMVTHDIGVVSYFVDGIACLNRRLKYSGDPRLALDCKLLEELYGERVSIFVHHPECEGCHVYRNSL